MHLQVLASGSKGNSALVRAGDTNLLVDAGLTIRELEKRLEKARVAPQRIGHVALTHGHLDHARCAGVFAKKSGARLHCCERLMSNASVRKAPRIATLRVGRRVGLDSPRGEPELELHPVKIPHDADPTVAFALHHGDRKAVVLTDMGEPDREVARALAGAHVLVLEFNHDAELLQRGPYTPRLKRRVAGTGGHLSNEEAATMLRWLAGPELHTLVLAHLSEVNNRPLLALEVARRTLDELDLEGVEVLVAPQHTIGPNLRV